MDAQPMSGATLKQTFSYHNKVVVAPMVRVSTLSFRLLCLGYGADMAYTEENVDRKIIASRRSCNEKLDCVEYLSSKSPFNAFFQTRSVVDTPMSFQIGTGDAQLALQACQVGT